MFDVESYGVVPYDAALWKYKFDTRYQDIIDNLKIGEIAQRIHFREGFLSLYKNVTRLPDEENT